MYITDRRKKILMNVKKIQVDFSRALWYSKLMKNRLQTNRFAVYIRGEVRYDRRRYIYTSPLLLCINFLFTDEEISPILVIDIKKALKK